jgi:hypothetical protein
MKKAVIPKKEPVINHGKAQIFSEFCIFSFFLIAVFFVFRGLFHTFFQQDEWVGYGVILGYGSKWLLQNYPLLPILAGNGRVISEPIQYLFYTFKPFDVTFFALFSIIIHGINTYLVYRIVRLLVNSKYSAIIGGLLFAFFYTPHEAITWFAASTTTLPSALFFLLALYMLISSWNKLTTVKLFSIQVLLVVSYLFKESDFAFLVAIPLFVSYLKTSNIKDRVIYVRKFVPVLSYFAYILLFRVYFSFVDKQSNPALVANSSHGLLRTLIHAIGYPLGGLSQILIPDTLLFPLAKVFSAIQYSFLENNPMRGAIQQLIITDFLSIIISLCIFGILIFLYTRWLEKRNIILISFGIYVLSFMPFIILDKSLSSYLSSRYYYLPAFAVTLFVALIIRYITTRQYKTIFLYFFVLLLSYSFICIYVYKNVQFIRRRISGLVIEANDRRNLLSSFTNQYPHLPDKPIIYLSGDSPGFYGLADVMVPLQQGPGYTLMVWYYRTGVIPETLIRENFLWNMYEEGYREIDGKGFGFFRNKNELIKTYQQNSNLNTNQLVGFFYNGSQKKLIDVTQSLRKEVEENRIGAKTNTADQK